MSIAVTGATGNLGQLVVEALITRGTPASDIVAVVRNPEKAADLAARGVVVRKADYTDAAALEAAFAGVDKVVLISGSEVGQRLAQHTNVINAAKAAGVGFIAYTSILDAQDTPMKLAAEHKATEDVLAASGIAFALLRNGWYWENFLNDLAGVIERGAVAGAGADGKIAAASRADYADAAAVVVTTDGHEGAVYELGGDERLTYAQFAEKVSEFAGKPVVYQFVPEEAYKGILESVGLPAPVAEILADSDAAIAKGALDTESGDLQKLIGRASTPVAEVLKKA
ncbi:MULTISPECIES: SDR family oxidoreductase [Rhodococcus]|uniref:SDR family oxidoreductase n=1 Tax=Rhodococcus TaxID=1827 RepID=UPI0015623F14|nr:MULTISPECIES: SDR family oxidoreductase [Rhodococcus]NRI66729.1 SDR family oxidoreductase [Rhodococcus sp. MS16]QXW04480.1 SDR family oxidoreductase [Rhodococcus globerulus]